MKSEKLIENMSLKMWRLSGSKYGVNGITLKGMQGMKFNTCNKQYCILVLSALRVLRRVNQLKVLIQGLYFQQGQTSVSYNRRKQG